MESDYTASSLGYASADHWLDVVVEELEWGVINLDRLVEYDAIFSDPPPPSAVTQADLRLLDAWLAGADDVLWDADALVNDDLLTADATRRIFDVLFSIDAASS